MKFQQVILEGEKRNNSASIKGNSRIAWIDAAKAFAICCIVLGHAINGNGILWHFVYGFHVPFFLILGGLIFSAKEEKLISYIIKKFKNIMIPYYFWGIVSICVYIAIAKIARESPKLTILQCLFGLVLGTAKNGYMHWNTPMWYLPMYFLIQIASYLILRRKPNVKVKVIYGIGSFIIAWGLYQIKSDILLPFGCSTAIFLYPFFAIGTFLNPILSKFDVLSKNVQNLTALGLIAASGCVIIYQDNIDYVTDVYRQYPLFVISAIGMSLGIILIIKQVPRYSSLVNLIGTNTLGIMILQKFPIYFFVHICPGIKRLYLSLPQVTSFFVTIITVLICAVFSSYGTRYVPWMFGRIVKRPIGSEGEEK